MASTEPTIRCFYSCTSCGLVKTPVDVPARGEENVVEWLEHIATPALAVDHRAKSPACRPKSLSNVIIPMTGTSKVGGPVEN